MPRFIDWDAEFRMPGVGAIRLRDVTREDLQRAARIMKRAAREAPRDEEPTAES